MTNNVEKVTYHQIEDSLIMGQQLDKELIISEEGYIETLIRLIFTF